MRPFHSAAQCNCSPALPFHLTPTPPPLQLLHQARAVITPNSISEAAATALSNAAPRLNESVQAAVAQDTSLSQLGHAGLLAVAVMCTCRYWRQQCVPFRAMLS